MKFKVYVFCCISGLFFAASNLASAQKRYPVEIEDEYHTDRNGDTSSGSEDPIPAYENLKLLEKAKAKNQRSQALPILKTFLEKGPTNYPGRINTVLVDDVHGIYLAGTATGGLWRFVPDRTVLGVSQTNATQWYKVNDFELSLSISKIVQDPADHNIIYYSTGGYDVTSGAGIFKSTDGGTTFSQLPSTNPQNYPDFSQIYTMAIHPVTKDIYVGLSRKVYVSRDNGNSFELIYNPDFYAGAVESIFFNASGAVLISSKYKGVFRSPDGSANSFVQLTNGITYSNGQSAPYFSLKIAGCETQRNVIYALISGPSNVQYLDGIYKTTNGGDSWTKVNDPKASVNYSQTTRGFVISVKPNDPNVLVSAGVASASSSDGGMTWKYIMNIGIDHADVVWEKNSSSVYFACDHGMYFHLDDTKMETYGNRADMTSNGMNNLQSYYGDYMPQGNGVLFGAQDNQSCVIRNNSTLAYSYTGGDGFCVASHKQDTNVVYGTVQYGALYRCDSISPRAWPSQYPKNEVSMLDNVLDANHDGQVDEGHGFYTQLVVSNSNSDVLFFPTRKKVYRSVNRGVNWTAISTDMPLTFGCFLAYGEQASPNLYIGSDNNFYRISNALSTGAVTPETLPLGLAFHQGISKVEVDPNDPSKVYLALRKTSGLPSYVYIYRLDDANATPVKVDISGDLPTFVNDVAIYPGNSNIIFAATDIGLFYTLNGGTNWNLVEEFPYVRVNDIKFRPSDKKLYIFTYGRGAWIAELDPQVITSTVSPSSRTLSKETNVYPSPFDHHIKIHTEPVLNTEVFVFDLNGKEWFHASDYTDRAEIPLKHLSTGFYVVKYKTPNGWKYETVVKQ